MDGSGPWSRNCRLSTHRLALALSRLPVCLPVFVLYWMLLSRPSLTHLALLVYLGKHILLFLVWFILGLCLEARFGTRTIGL
jgi:hypothetical protein